MNVVLLFVCLWHFYVFYCRRQTDFRLWKRLANEWVVVALYMEIIAQERRQVIKRTRRRSEWTTRLLGVDAELVITVGWAQHHRARRSANHRRMMFVTMVIVDVSAAVRQRRWRLLVRLLPATAERCCHGCPQLHVDERARWRVLDLMSVSHHSSSGGATPGRARSNDLAGRSTALPIALLR